MRHADRYLWGELILPFLVATVAVLLMLVGNTLYALLDQIMRDKWPLALVARLLALNVPVVLVLTLPVSTALAVALATNRLARDNEITALRASGVSLGRAFAPALLFGLLVSAVTFYISDKWVPWAWREQQNVNGFLDTLSADPVKPNFTIGGDPYAITAEQVQKVSQSRRRLIDCRIFAKPDSTLAVPTGDPKSKMVLPFSTFATAETAEYDANSGLWHLIGVRQHVFAPDGRAIIETQASDGYLPFSLASFRPTFGQSEQFDKYSWADLTRQSAEAARFGDKSRARALDLERWFKLALPLMAGVFAFLTPPLSLRFARTGAFTGILISMVIVAVVWVALPFVKSFGPRLPVPPAVIALAPNLLLLGLGAYLLRRAE